MGTGKTGEAIKLSELRALTNGLFDVLAKAGIDHISIAQNLYWTVHVSEAFALAEPAPTMGDVLDDLADLRSEVMDQTPDTNVVVWHAFEHLSGLMKSIAYADLGGNLTSAVASAGENYP